MQQPTGDTNHSTDPKPRRLTLRFTVWQLVRCLPVSILLSLAMLPIVSSIPSKRGDLVCGFIFLSSLVPAVFKWISELAAIRLFLMLMGLFLGGICWLGLYRMAVSSFSPDINTTQATITHWVNAGTLLVIMLAFMLSHVLMYISFSMRPFPKPTIDTAPKSQL
ncbi:MAG: hypothetical protein ACF8OB_03140 [Phycisphaeraceae bacterium JB051]